jgi:hypothetical protein
MDLARRIEFRVGDKVRVTGMSLSYGTTLPIGFEGIVQTIHVPGSMINGSIIRGGPWIRLVEDDRAHGMYEVRYFELVEPYYSENDVIDCIHDLLKTVPKKGKKWQASKNTTS